jgi:hypothetical protein
VAINQQAHDDIGVRNTDERAEQRPLLADVVGKPPAATPSKTATTTTTTTTPSASRRNSANKQLVEKMQKVFCVVGCVCVVDDVDAKCSAVDHVARGDADAARQIEEDQRADRRRARPAAPLHARIDLLAVRSCCYSIDIDALITTTTIIIIIYCYRHGMSMFGQPPALSAAELEKRVRLQRRKLGLALQLSDLPEPVHVCYHLLLLLLLLLLFLFAE